MKLVNRVLVVKETPPLARGRPRSRRALHGVVGNTPACAGKTLPELRVITGLLVLLLLRGYWAGPTLWTHSPLARGRPAAPGHPECLTQISNCKGGMVLSMSTSAPHAGSFDLLTEPWIHVMTLTGRHQVLGVKDVVAQADQIAAVTDPDPGVEAAVLRLLIAVTQAALGGPTKDNPDIPHNYPSDRVLAYLDTVADRFDLGHPTRPFLQSTWLRPIIQRSPTLLAFPFLAGEAKTLHPGYADEADSMDAADAARYLLAVQMWGNGQTTSAARPTSTTGEAEQNKSTPAGIFAGALIAFPIGGNLAETLLLNLHAAPDLGTPVWEVDSGDAPSGWLGRLVWPARSYLLSVSTDGHTVTGIRLGVGHRPPPDTMPEDGKAASHPPAAVVPEPHFIYAAAAKDGKRKHLGASDTKGLWRESPIIYGFTADTGSDQVLTATQRLFNQDKALGAVAIYGRNNAGQKLTTVQIRALMPLPVGFMHEDSLAPAQIGLALAALEDTGKDLVQALKAFYTATADGKAAGHAASLFWWEAEPVFRHLLDRCAAEPFDEAVITSARDEFNRSMWKSSVALFDEEARNLPAMEYGQQKAKFTSTLSRRFPYTAHQETAA